MSYVQGMVSTLSSARGVGPPAVAVAYREWAPPPALAPWVRRVVAAAVQLLERHPALPVGVGGLGAALGLGDRQLRRRFLAAVGYGPKTLARVLRFQRLLGLLDGSDGRAWGPSLAAAATDAGYADQAHMTTECTRLAGLAPTALLAERRHPAQPA